MPQQTSGFNNSQLVKAISETRRLLVDMDHRILRQQKRIEKTLVNREGETADMQALLADMIEARNLMQDQLDSFAKEEAANAGSERETQDPPTET